MEEMMTINQSIDQSSNQSSSDPIGPCNGSGMMYNDPANQGDNMTAFEGKNVRIIKHDLPISLEQLEALDADLHESPVKEWVICDLHDEVIPFEAIPCGSPRDVRYLIKGRWFKDYMAAFA
jgi:hypothetical protein